MLERLIITQEKGAQKKKKKQFGEKKMKIQD